MNKVEIKSDGSVEVLVNGALMKARGVPVQEPDRITITLTEREAELVHCLCGYPARGQGSYGRDAWVIYDALRFLHNPLCFEGVARPTQCDVPLERYASAGYNAQPEGYTGPDTITLTMDRDVAVTLYELICRVEPRGELDGVFRKLAEAGVYTMGGEPDRFTGTIRWKKKRLCSTDCEIGKTYRRVETSPYEQVMWEEA